PPTPSMRAVIMETKNPEITPITWVMSCKKIFRLIDKVNEFQVFFLSGRNFLMNRSVSKNIYTVPNIKNGYEGAKYLNSGALIIRGKKINRKTGMKSSI